MHNDWQLHFFLLRGKKSLCKSQQFERCNDGGILSHTHLQTYAYDIWRRNQKGKGSQMKKRPARADSFILLTQVIWSSFWNSFCRIIAYLCAVVFNVQCQLPNGQKSSTFIEEKKQNKRYVINWNLITTTGTLSRARTHLFTQQQQWRWQRQRPHKIWHSGASKRKASKNPPQSLSQQIRFCEFHSQSKENIMLNFKQFCRHRQIRIVHTDSRHTIKSNNKRCRQC